MFTSPSASPSAVSTSSLSRLVAAALVALAVFANVVRAQTPFIDTGPGNASGGYSLFNTPPDFNLLACRFTQAGAFTIGTVQPWMVKPSGSVVVKLCANNGSNLPGSTLASQTFATSFAGFSASWVSFAVSGSGWSQPAGTYWICFEPTSGTDFGGMPGNAPNPLPATAFFTNGNPGYVLNGAGDVNGRFGLRLYAPAPPAAINVPADQPTIQAAIDAASLPNQEIIVAPGTYNEAINFNGKTIVVRASGRGKTTTIDATAANTHAVTIGSGSASGTRLEGFTITGGSTGGEGGGVHVSGSTVTVKNCVIVGNQADSGAGAAVDSAANATFDTCTFDTNTADTLGGGAYVNGATATFTGCTFEANDSASDAGGLNVNNNATVTVTNCDFVSNTAGNAGGAVVVIGSGANLTASGSTFTDNSALQAGGVMVNIASAGFTNCDFIGNHATIMAGTSGGGIQVQATSTVTLTGCAFTGNDAAYGAGAQFLGFTGTATFAGCAFEDNIAAIAGGAVYRGFGGTSSPAVGTSTFCGSEPEHIAGTWTNSGGNTFTEFCDADPGDSDGNGVVNVDDLISIILAWGSCPAAPANCPGDVNHNGSVDVDDLIMVILNWG